MSIVNSIIQLPDCWCCMRSCVISGKRFFFLWARRGVREWVRRGRKLGKENQRETTDGRKVRGDDERHMKSWMKDENSENVVMLSCVIDDRVLHGPVIASLWYSSVALLTRWPRLTVRLRMLHLLCSIASTIHVLLLILRTSAASRNRAYNWKTGGVCRHAFNFSKMPGSSKIGAVFSEVWPLKSMV